MPTVIVPVLNEAAALPGLLAAMPAGYHALVVDNGSTDRSGPVAAGMGAAVISEPRRGFGAACWAGLMVAGPDDGVVCFMDGDGSLDPSDLPLVAGPVLAGVADLVLGARRTTQPRAWPVHARLANAFLTAELRRRTGRALGLTDRRSGWPLEMVLRAGQAGWRVDEVPVTYAPRIGKSTVTGSVRGTLGAVHDMGRVLH